MSERAFNRRVKVIIGTPRIDSESYIFQEDIGIPERSSSTKGDSTRFKITSVPAGKTINISNVEPNSTRAFYFKLESTRGTSGGGTSNEKTVVELQNLNEETLEILHSPNARILVYLGYEGTSLDLYYAGDIYDIQPSGFGDGDITYRITCTDGAADSVNTRVALAYEETTPVSEILADMVKKFPSSSLGDVAIDIATPRFVQGGLVIQGNLSRVFNKYCKMYGVSALRYNGKISLQPYQLVNGTPEYINIGKNTYTVPPSAVKTLDPIIQNGGKYIDNKNTKRGVQLVTFLTPMELGQFFTILPETSKTLAGTYKITAIKIDANLPLGNFDVIVNGEPM